MAAGFFYRIPSLQWQQTRKVSSKSSKGFCWHVNRCFQWLQQFFQSKSSSRCLRVQKLFITKFVLFSLSLTLFFLKCFDQPCCLILEIFALPPRSSCCFVSEVCLFLQRPKPQKFYSSEMMLLCAWQVETQSDIPCLDLFWPVFLSFIYLNLNVSNNSLFWLVDAWLLAVSDLRSHRGSRKLFKVSV